MGGLVARWREVMDELVHSRGTALKRYGYLLCGDEAGAADLVQEALVRTFARPRLNWTVAELEPYVKRVMLNNHLDNYRKKGRWRRLLPRLAEPQTATDPAIASIDRLAVFAALRLLSPQQRACLVLRYYEDLQVAEIADQFGCSQGAVKRHLNVAITRLRATLSVTKVEG
jgi:RNA polymerase sigma factor (sigma-70 family)